VQRCSARQALQCHRVWKHVIFIMSECCLDANTFDSSHGYVEHHSGVNACMCVAHFGNESQCSPNNHWFKTDLAHGCSLSLLACACKVNVSTFLLLVGMVSQRCKLARNLLADTSKKVRMQLSIISTAFSLLAGVEPCWGG